MGMLQQEQVPHPTVRATEQPLRQTPPIPLRARQPPQQPILIATLQRDIPRLPQPRLTRQLQRLHLLVPQPTVFTHTQRILQPTRLQVTPILMGQLAQLAITTGTIP